MIINSTFWLFLLWVVLSIITVRSIFTNYKLWKEEESKGGKLIDYIFRDLYIIGLCVLSFAFLIFDVFRK
jgi:hypothetical protein